MRRITQQLMGTRTALYAVLALAVAGVSVKEFAASTRAGTQAVGNLAPLLIVGVATVLLLATFLEYDRRRTAADITIAVLAFVAGPLFAFVYADFGAAVLGPLVALGVLLPHVRLGRATALLVSGTVMVMVADAVLFSLRQQIAPVGSAEIVNAVVSVATAGVATVFLVVSQRRELESNGRKYADLFNSLPVAAFRSSPGGRLIAINDTMVRLYGAASQEQLLQTHAADLYADPVHRERLIATLETNGQARGEIQILRADGARRWVRYQMHVQRSDLGAVNYIEGVLEDMTAESRLKLLRSQREETAKALKRLSPSLPPNELASAVAGQITADGALKYAIVLAVAADGSLFVKGGAVEGRPVERQRLEGAVLPDNFAERLPWGPWVDDFPQLGAELLPAELAANLRDVAYIPLIAGGIPVGVLLAGTGTGDRQYLTEQLPVLMDFAPIVTALLGPSLVARRTDQAIRRRLEDVIESGAFHPVFQPIVALSKRRVIGYEALTRFDDGTPPDVMFELARTADMETALEASTMLPAVRALAWLPKDLPLHLNVSPALVQACEPLRTHLTDWGPRVVLELTEHAVVADYEGLREAIRELGTDVVLAVDDAGAGFASLTHILELAPTFVKLDRHIVTGIDRDPARQALVAGMAHFARQAGITLIAEGVETEPEASTLMKLRVPAAQGYLFGRPSRMLEGPRTAVA